MFNMIQCTIAVISINVWLVAWGGVLFDDGRDVSGIDVEC